MLYDLAVFIGRFSPFHNGHLHVIREGLEQASNVLVLIGSSNSPRNYRNPFTFRERRTMITNSVGPGYGDGDRVYIEPLEDIAYNDARWVENIQMIVNEYTNDESKVALIGHSKDHSSYYLKLFPQWGSINVGNVESLSSTDIRNDYFSNIPVYGRNKVPVGTNLFLDKFLHTPDFDNIVEEYTFVQRYKQSWASAPYEPIFVTVDACVVQSGHVLLVQRKARPGKGLWALPGGFLNPSEKIEDGVLRELKEETGIKVPVPVIRGSFVASRVFDDPFRSSRGRTITHAFLYNLRPEISLPKVKGSDDAEQAKWVPLSEIRRDMMFEDHMDMILNLTALL